MKAMKGYPCLGVRETLFCLFGPKGVVANRGVEGMNLEKGQGSGIIGGVVSALVMAWCALPAAAQGTPERLPYSELFDQTGGGGLGTSSWTMGPATPPAILNDQFLRIGTAQWAIDNTPRPGFSPQNSLNYNNQYGTYQMGLASFAFATSPLIAFYPKPPLTTVITQAKLTFECLYDTETGLEPGSAGPRGNSHDCRIFRILDNQQIGVLHTRQYLSLLQDPPLGPGGVCGLFPPDTTEICPNPTTTSWHLHTLTFDKPALDPDFNAVININGIVTEGSVHFRYIFHTDDNLFNDHQGWFIDNIGITAPGLVSGGGGGSTGMGADFDTDVERVITVGSGGGGGGSRCSGSISRGGISGRLFTGAAALAGLGLLALGILRRRLS